ncbi:cell envelope biogenesis protein OmpA [Bacteroidia bacterium]|nr:cell envelope biogenesis protein OmpA [Bacteroidia bacterium]
MLTGAALYAQGTQAAISGTVSDSQGVLPGATVQVRNESTGFSAGTITNVNGEYTFRQLPLGSPYTVTVSYIGFGEQRKSGYSLNQGDLLQINFKLQEEALSIDAVTVVANSLKKGIDRMGASTSMTPKDIHTLPVNGRNFTSLMELSPLSNGSNLAGQLATSTSYQIDGMTARGPLSGSTSNRGPYLVSMEAIREFGIVTNDYDVTQGRAGGGSISSVTKSGTNQFSGSVFIYHRANELSSPYDARGNKRTDKYAISQYGFTSGGAIIKNKLHYFVAWDHQQDSRPFYIADLQNRSDEIRYGINKENLDEFLRIARSSYGVASSPQTGSFDKVRPSNTVFARLDWQLNATNLLTVRNNFNHDKNTLGVGDNTSINLYEVYGTHYTQDNSLLASLRSILGLRLMNEAKLQYLYTKDDGRPSEQLPPSNIPRAIVENIVSSIENDNGEVGAYRTNIQLGGQRYLPELFINNVVQFVDNLYYSTNKVNYVFGIDAMYTHLNSKATSEMNGRFYYSGLDAFRENKPYRYVREVPVGDPTVKQGVLNSALYGQLQFKPFYGGEISAGIRADYTTYFSNPANDPLLTSELGLKTTYSVKSFQLQPRVQLTWDINNRQTDIIKVGAGIFGSNLNNYSMVNNLEFDGQRVVAFDRSAPNGGELGITPDFIAYRKNPASAPGAELFQQFGLPKVATYNINSEHTKVPTIYKFSAYYNHFFSDRLRLGVAGYVSLARNNYMYVDRNMVDAPFFRLGNEGGRGVYVPASSISTSRGTTDWTSGRKSENIGRVLELVSEGKNNTYTFVADATWRYFQDGQITASYTWNDSKDNTSYNGNVANSATLYQMVVDDPRDLSTMNYSDVQFRHKIVFYGSSPTFHGFTVGLRYSGLGGTRYSMVVNGNINGDFVTGNDLAFVFDPNSPGTSQEIRDGINGLLNNEEVAESFKTYLRESSGKVAKRNGGVNGLNGVCDLRITKRFDIYRKHGVELSFDIFNVANLLDKEKGLVKNLGKQNLYSVTGFDAGKQQYTYSVNKSAGIITPSGNPWQMQFGLKYSF